MKKLFSTRMLALTLALTMLVLAAGCGNRGDTSSSAQSSSSSSEASSSKRPAVEKEDVVQIDRVFQIEKIDKGIERNPDTKGWLYIPNTDIDDAVLQASDNNYYLRLDEDKNYDVFGCYFADHASKLNDRSSMSRNTIIYGHSDLKDNPDGKKFSQLFRYTDIDFLRENPYIYFSTAEDDMIWQIFAVFFTHIDFVYIQPNPTQAQFDEIIEGAMARNQYITNVEVGSQDDILTLSTCTAFYNPNDHDNYRLVVMAKLLPSDEVSAEGYQVEPNPNILKT